MTEDFQFADDLGPAKVIEIYQPAAGLKADSQISVNYQYAPFLGGGNSSLVGFNVGLDIGHEGRFSTTWLYESNQVVGHKAKLGDEPSRKLVGNINGALMARPAPSSPLRLAVAALTDTRARSAPVSAEMVSAMASSR